MKILILTAISMLSAMSFAETITRRTGAEQVISLSECSSAVGGINSGVFQSYFVKYVCEELETYEANVEGSFWNTKETRTSNSTYTYRLAQQTITKTNYLTRANTGDAAQDELLNTAKSMLLAAETLNECNSAKNVLYPLLINVKDSKCGK